jgi:hypothetical protein
MLRTAFTALAVAAVSTGALGVPAASAATLGQLINNNQRFILEDDSAEDLNVDRNDDGLLDIGDTLRGIFSFPFFQNSVTGERSVLDGTANSAVHGVFEAEVLTKTGAGQNPAGLDVFNYTFGPYAPFATEVGGVEGAIIGLWESSEYLNPFNCGATKAACEEAAKEGDLRLVLGFEEGTGTFTTSPLPDDLDLARDVSQSRNIGTYQFDMSVLLNAVTDLPFINVPGFDSEVLGSGQILGSAGNTGPYPTFNDADIEMAVVPIPAALPLFLAGLGALGMIGRRRNAT